MNTQRTFLFLTVVLGIISIANADLVLTLNDIDAAKESVEIKGKENLLIAIAGDANVDPNAYYVKATGGVLETIPEPNAICSQSQTCAYSFTFEDESSGGVISLTANNEMIIDGISVEGGDTIYELVLFYIEETDTVVAFGINLESLSYIPQEPELEPEIQPELEPESDAEAQPKPEPATEPETIASSAQDTVAIEDISAADEAEDFNLPLNNYWQDEQEKRQKNLMYCPADSNSETFSRAAYEAWIKEHSQDRENAVSKLSVTEANIIEINSDITTNQIWTADNIYYITNWVYVQALLVIEPGTEIWFGRGCAMFVNNGGTLISAGTPNNLIVYTPYVYDPFPGWYYCPIYVEETASPSTKITYSYVEFATVGIVTANIRLDTPIENNYLFYNSFGIGELGTHHTDIINNISLGSYNSGMDIYMDTWFGEGIADANSHILIQNNTCDWYQDCGITVHGVPDENDAGLVMLINNIVTRALYCGLNLVDGYLTGIVSNTGYGSNYMNKNFDFPEDNPVEANDNPYILGQEYWDVHYLDQNCPFIDAGLGYIEETPLVGMTTDINGTPDSNKIDIGFHHLNWSFSNAGDGNMLSADLNRDMIVNFKDFATLAAGWQTTYNLDNLSTMADEWLRIASANPTITVTISGDPCNLTGEVSIGVSGYGVTTERVFVLMDGEYIDELEYFDSNTPLLLDTDNYRNGGHSFKVVAIDINGLFTVSNTFDVNFGNVFYNIIASDYFHPTADYIVSGFHNSSGSFEAEVTNYNGQILWSNSYSGPLVSIVIPGTAFGNEQFCELSITDIGSGIMATSGESGTTGGSSATKKDVAKKFNQTDCPAGVKMVIVLPNKDVFKVRKPAIFECANACDNRGVSWVSLYHHDVTEDNLRFLYNKSSVGYIYWCGHANSHVGRNEKLGIEGVQRTHTICWRYEKSGWWDFINNWPEIGAFSHTRQTVPDAPLLPDDWDTRGFDLWSLGMYDSWNKKIVFVDGCLSAKYNDMAKAYGMFSLQGQGSLDQIYIGWRIKVLVSTGIMEQIVGNTTEGVRMFWERMGLGDSVYDALYYTYVHGGGGMQEALWGLNGIPDIGVPEGDDNIFLWGNGLIDQMELEP